MRVLLINKFHYLKGGAERAYFDTADILAENGHPVAFFAMQHTENRATPWDRFFVSAVDYHDVTADPVAKLRAAARIIWNREAAAKLEALILEFRPDVAHLHNIYHQLSPSILWVLRKHKVRVVMTLHDYKLISPNYNLLVRGKIWDHTSGLLAIGGRAVQDSYLKSLVCAFEQWAHRFIHSYGLVNAYLAPSRFLIERFRQAHFPYFIRHVVQPIRPFPPVPVYQAGEYFLYLGRLAEEKGVSTLIEAAWKLQEGDRKTEIRIVGTGPAEAALRAQAKGITSIQFLGYQTGADWERILAGAKALVVPSFWYENMPYVVLEALSRGKPVIASRMGGLPERVIDETSGWLFEAGDVADLVRAIRKLDLYPSPEALAESCYRSVSDARPERYYEELMKVYSGPRIDPPL